MKEIKHVPTFLKPWTFLNRVYRVVSKLKAGNGIERKEGSGRPRILDTKDHRHLAQIVRAGPMKSVENIRQRMIERRSPAVSNATVNRELHTHTHTHTRTRTRTRTRARTHTKAILPLLLTETHKQMHLNWCHEHQNLLWDNVIFFRWMFCCSLPSSMKKPWPVEL